MKLLEKLANRPWVRRSVVILIHVVLWSLAFAVALELRFDGVIVKPFAQNAPRALVLLVLCRVGAFYASGLFHGLWRYAGMPELKNLVWATSLGTLAFSLGGIMARGVQMPRSIYVGEWLTSIVLVGGIRFLIRIVRERRTGQRPTNGTPTLIVGAGDAGESLLRDVQRMRDAKWVISGFLDDNPGKAGTHIRGVSVLGSADEATLTRVIREQAIKLVVLAIPAADGKRTRDIVGVCRRLGVQAKTVPSLADRIDNAEFAFSNLREIAIDDLLRRDPVKLDVGQVKGFIAGRTLMVTGAGGSIGSELCRQALRFQPRAVLLFEHDENALFHIERELRAAFPSARIEAIIGDITDAERVSSVFRRFKPDVVLHAAAHKHVPMMESNPCEAVKNNVLGTMIVAEAARAFSCDTFVLISTDKAVNPSSVMGATKRVAELIVQLQAERSATRFVAVRFGNVLGSAGSVVPLFREQIAKGGPVTVTHPDVRRYFMTIPEATQLVLQASALGGTGGIFVLDMGQPIRISDLARDLIELSGLRPDIDISIEYTGLRPGEKLFEELLHDGEAFGETPHPKIMVGRIKPTPREVVERGLEALALAARTDEQAARKALSELVPEARLGTATTSTPSDAPGEASPIPQAPQHQLVAQA